MKVTVYHNPRCSKSRATVKLLENAQIKFDIRLYLQDIPSIEEIKNLVGLLGFSSARELMRRKEAVYKDLQLATVDDETTLLSALHQYPKLIERPIVVVDERVAKIGRPPESVLDLFKSL